MPIGHFPRTSTLRSEGAALFETPLQPFEAGDKVRCKYDLTKGRKGIVVVPPWDRSNSVRAGPDQVWVLFEGDAEAARRRRSTLERVLRATSALPHVGGQTTRFKAEPTKLTGVALRVMAASGDFGACRSGATSTAGVWFGGLALMLAAGVIVITGSDSLTSDRAGAPVAAKALSPPPAQVQSQSANERLPSVAPTLVTTSAPNPAPVQEVASADMIDSQYRFEIDRFYRRGAVAVGDKAPASGPTQR